MYLPLRKAAGLTSHGQHALVRKQLRGFGGVVCLELRGGIPVAERFVSRLKLFLLAEIHGGVESRSSSPSKKSHRAFPESERYRRGTGDNLVRLSAGIEDSEDLLEDLKQALEAV